MPTASPRHRRVHSLLKKLLLKGFRLNQAPKHQGLRQAAPRCTAPHCAALRRFAYHRAITAQARAEDGKGIRSHPDVQLRGVLHGQLSFCFKAFEELEPGLCGRERPAYAKCRLRTQLQRALATPLSARHSSHRHSQAWRRLGNVPEQAATADRQRGCRV